MKFASIFSDDYLVSTWAPEFEAYKSNGTDAALLGRLRNWDQRDPKLSETQTEAAFIRLFFEELWGFWPTGSRDVSLGFCMVSQSKVAGAGQTGGTGAADLALGWFGRPGIPPVGQVQCEFKDVKSGLDAPQNRKGNPRSPVRQCFDYLRGALEQTPTNSSLHPAWGIVSDMNEFRLYLRRLGEGQVQRFIIRARPSEMQTSLLEESEGGRQQRFLFSRLFHRESLLAESGVTPLERVLDAQGIQERALEGEFYREYSAYREHLFNELVAANPDYAGKKWKLVRLAQRLLDRLLFIMFAEDMGKALRFPRDLLRDTLSEHSRLRSYNPNDHKVWSDIKDLFRSMADGVPFGKETIPRFNGGLFQEDKELEGLNVPTRVFCLAGQGESAESMLLHPKTLHYFSAKYNFGAAGARQQRTIGLYTLGRIFEQSLTDLEVMEAHAAGRESLAEISKRKRDGVYYTPEWVTAYIVQETVGRRLDEIKVEVARSRRIPEGFTVTNEETALWRKQDPRERRERLRRKEILRKEARALGLNGGASDEPAPPLKTAIDRVDAYMGFVEEYLQRLEKFTVLDPACGSGAFLIQALELLLRERRWVAEERGRIEGQLLFDNDVLVRETLGNNIFGVDINSESVEITKLAMWLHTALPGKPLCALDDNIRCGNSLVGPEFASWYGKKRGLLFASLDEGVQAKVNVFDWRAAFPRVFEAGGFDAVVGNPPYVKLQHFRRVEADVAEFLTEARRADGTPVYRSTQTGNFDLYLPFIEKGIGLLKPDGRMGFIAPSLWLVNEYGEGLKGVIRESRVLERWVDFQSFQVFEEAITYTALQFFRKAANERLRFALHPDSDLSPIEWSGTSDSVPYGSLPEAVDPWHFLPVVERTLLERLRRDCHSLEQVAEQIFQGLVTSADGVYHLERLGKNRYRRQAKFTESTVLQIEDELMQPLVSGKEAKRYQTPQTNTYLLFPYELDAGKPRLWTAAEMGNRFPVGWQYLQDHAIELRGRENGKMDRDGDWWAYVYPKNLDKHRKPKLVVPRLVYRLVCSIDFDGSFYLDNVDVGGVLPKDPRDLGFLGAVLNSPVANFVFRRTSKPFQNDYRSANKQFIAPLPIPRATDDQKAEVGARARRLHELHSKRRDVVAALEQRLLSAQTESDQREESWLWADVKSARHWAKSAPADKSGRTATAWAKDHFHVLVSQRLEHLSAVLVPGTVLSAQADNGELRVTSHAHVLLRTYEDEATAPFIAAQWRHALRDLRITEVFDPSKLLRLLLSLRKTDNSALRDQVVKLDAEIQQLDRDIAAAEAEMNEIVYGLYGLSEEERKVVEGGKAI